MPFRMIYEPSSLESTEVDVYHFYQEPETLETFVTCWVVDYNYWLTVPLYTVKPVNNKTNRKQLLEEST